MFQGILIRGYYYPPSPGWNPFVQFGTVWYFLPYIGGGLEYVTWYDMFSVAVYFNVVPFIALAWSVEGYEYPIILTFGPYIDVIISF